MPIECEHGEMHHSNQRRQWECPNGCMAVTDQLAAANRLGPWAPPRRASLVSDIPGYARTGPTSYERIGPGPDFRDVWQAQFHQPVVTATVDRESAAIADAASALIGEGARDLARELLAATRRR
jgi:hypothetical protein